MIPLQNLILIQLYCFFGNWALPLTMNISVNFSSNSKIRVSFEICLPWGFQSTPYMLNLMKFWLSYLRLKRNDSLSKSNFNSTLLLLWKLSLAFNHEYLCEFFTKFKDQWQFWNLLAMWILKLSFIFMINEELTEIFKVKGKAQFPIHLEKQAT